MHKNWMMLQENYMISLTYIIIIRIQYYRFLHNFRGDHLVFILWHRQCILNFCNWLQDVYHRDVPKLLSYGKWSLSILFATSPHQKEKCSNNRFLPQHISLKIILKPLWIVIAIVSKKIILHLTLPSLTEQIVNLAKCIQVIISFIVE